MSKKIETGNPDEKETEATVDDSGTAIDSDDAATEDDQVQASGKDYEPAEFDDTTSKTDSKSRPGDTNLDVILDIPVTLSMEVGRTRVSIQDLLQLAKGSVVELDRVAGEPLDVLVNGTLVARGEVVVVNDKFGVRLNDVISPADRVHMLK